MGNTQLFFCTVSNIFLWYLRTQSISKTIKVISGNDPIFEITLKNPKNHMGPVRIVVRKNKKRGGKTSKPAIKVVVVIYRCNFLCAAQRTKDLANAQEAVCYRLTNLKCFLNASYIQIQEKYKIRVAKGKFLNLPYVAIHRLVQQQALCKDPPMQQQNLPVSLHAA